MMERYAGMGTELVHTYIGGLKALDVALDRMPPPSFDTAGIGYALSPELRAGDPYGAGASPRVLRGMRGQALTPTAAPAFAQLPGQRSGLGGGRASPYAGDSRDRWRSGTERARVEARRGDYDRLRNRGSDLRRSDRSYHRGRSGLFGYGSGDWWGYGDAYRYLESGPEGYFNSGPYRYFYGGYGAGAYARGHPRGYGYGYPLSDPYAYGYSQFSWDEPYLDYGWNDPYRSGGVYPYRAPPGSPDAYGSGYGMDVPYGYHPGASYGYAVDPRDPYGYAVDPWERDRYGDRMRSTSPYPADYDDIDARAGSSGRPGAAADMTPAEDWGIAGEMGAQEDAAPVSTVPARPAPHRPGFLLPPEERLRRPWLDD